MQLHKSILAVATAASLFMLATADKIEFCNQLVDGKCPYGSKSCTTVDFDKPERWTKPLNIPDHKAKGDKGSCGRVSKTSMDVKKMKVMIHFDGIYTVDDWHPAEGWVISGKQKDGTSFEHFQVSADIF